MTTTPVFDDAARARNLTCWSCLAACVLWAATACAPLAATRAVTSAPLAEAARPAGDEGARRALVIGNADYPGASLQNPVNDARAVEDALRATGFSVTRHTNLRNKREFRDAVGAFVDGLADGDTALVFYAGHGIEMKGDNYLLPVDFNAHNEDDAVDEGYRVQTLLDRLSNRSRATNIVILDACRNDPFSRRWSRGATSRGFKSVDVSAPGTFIAFSTGPGETAADAGGGANSPFTQALVQHMATPGLDITDVMRRVRSDVLASTSQRQTPWSRESLGPEGFRFNTAASAPPAVKCPAGTTWDGSACAAEAVRCPAGSRWNGSACEGERVASLPKAPPPPPAPAPRRAGETRVEPKTGATWVWMPPGSFRYGCEPQDTQCDDDEKPGRRESVDGFWMLQTEVTDDAWRACERAGACAPRSCAYGRLGAGREPAVCAEQPQAQDFCRWLGGRLPTAVEWEYAAKSGGSRVYPWGDAPPDATRANCDGFGDRFERLAPVGSFPAGDSAWGLKDMSGNVWEWTASWYDNDKIEIRGGGWYNDPPYLRAGIRRRVAPGARNVGYGFRCAQ
ncbi:MAG: hypothetical protein FJ137_20500 [Deltaproteobacteria bacterium]|nr:hypothetical protein [Deltaproteobacteria bacterium]